MDLYVDDVVVYRTWSSTLRVHVELVRWRTASSSASVRPTMSAARVNDVPKVTTGRRKDLTSVLVFRVSVTTALARVTRTPEPALSVQPSTVYLLTYLLTYCHCRQLHTDWAFGVECSAEMDRLPCLMFVVKCRPVEIHKSSAYVLGHQHTAVLTQNYS